MQREGAAAVGSVLKIKRRTISIVSWFTTKAGESVTDCAFEQSICWCYTVIHSFPEPSSSPDPPPELASTATADAAAAAASKAPEEKEGYNWPS